MRNFKKTHNIAKEDNFRSLSGYAGQELVMGRLMLCGFNVLRSLWRDSKYDGVFEVNNVSIKIEIKQTSRDKFTVTSGGRAGEQINRATESREKLLNKEDADFFFGVSTLDATCWMIPIELIEILERKTYDFKNIELFKEKFQIFLGSKKLNLSTEDIRNGFSKFKIDELENIINLNKFEISNKDKVDRYSYPKDKIFGSESARLKLDEVNYKQSLIIDIWLNIFKNI